LGTEEAGESAGGGRRRLVGGGESRGRVEGPAHTRRCQRLAPQRPEARCPREQAHGGHGCRVATLYSGEGRPRRGARGPGEDGGASDGGCRAARRSEVRNHAEAESSAGGNNGGRGWSARSTPESEEGRAER